MNYNNGIANYLTGPSGRFDLADPSTQAMVRDVMGSPNNAPKYGVSLPEIFQLHRALNAISSQTPQPKPTTVADDLKMAALQAIQAPNAAPPQMPQMPQMPPQGIQQAMPQPQMPQSPMDQGLGGMPAPAMDNAQFAGGGIVAFADNGLVTVPPGAPPEGNMLPPGTAMDMYGRILAGHEAELAAAAVPTYEQQLAADRAAREAAGIKGKLGEERLKKLEGATKKDAETEARNERFALAKAGFEMAAAAAKPGAKFLGSAAQGATAGLTDYVASQEKLRALQAERDKEIANIQNLQRAEDLGFVKDASGKIEKARDRVNDITKNINTTQTAMAGQMATTEDRRAQIASAEKLAGMRIAADRTLEEFRQAGNVDATMLKEYNAAMAAPVAEREAALKAWNDKYSSIAKIKSESRSPEKTFAAEQATLRKMNEAWDNQIITRNRLRGLQRRADAGDATAAEELAREKEKFERDYMRASQKNTPAPSAATKPPTSSNW